MACGQRRGLRAEEQEKPDNTGRKEGLEEASTASPALLSSSAPADSRRRGHHAGLAKVQVGRYPLVDGLSAGGVIRHRAWNSGVRPRALGLLSTVVGTIP